jgi:DNA-binding transcriptional MocR family regulator
VGDRQGPAVTAVPTGTAARVVDLTGRIPAWPAASRRQLLSCMRRVPRRSWSDHAAAFGHPPLRAALARQLGGEPDDVVVVTGVRPAVHQQARAHDAVVLERPTYSGVVNAARRTGTPCVQADWGDPLLAAAGGSGTHRALCVVTTPWRNPDGRTVDERFAAGLADLAASGHTVVLNETYRFAAHAAGVPDGPAVPGALLVGSLAKVAGGGVRLGWVRGAGAVESLGGSGQMWAHPPVVWQEAWANFLDEGGLHGLTAHFHGRPAAAASAFLDALPEAVRAAVVGEGAYLLLNLRVDEDTALAGLAAHGVLAGPGRDFHTPRPALRLAFTCVAPPAARRAAQAFGRCAGFFAAPTDVQTTHQGAAR